MKLGFNFVPMPQEIWDNCEDLSLGEFRLLGYIIRHTVGFRNESIRLTDDELEHGRKGTNGVRLDKGCGMTVNTIKTARDKLIERGMIEVINKEYRAKLDVVSNIDTQRCQTLTPCSNIEERQLKDNSPSESDELKQQPDDLTNQQKNQRFYAHFWNIYPNRFNWRACFNRYNELVDSGEATVEEIEAGANRVVKWLAEGKIGGKQFVVSAPKFLSDYRFRDTDPPRGNYTPTAAIVAREQAWEREKRQLSGNSGILKQYVGNPDTLIKRPEDPHAHAQAKSKADSVYLRRLASIGDGTDEDTKIIDGNKMWWVSPKLCSMTLVEAQSAWNLYWKSFPDLEPPKMATNYLEDFWNNRLTSCKNWDILKASNT